MPGMFYPEETIRGEADRFPISCGRITSWTRSIRTSRTVSWQLRFAKITQMTFEASRIR